MAPTSSKRLANAQPWVKTALDVFENFSALVPVPGVQPAVQAISAMCALLQNVNDQVFVQSYLRLGSIPLAVLKLLFLGKKPNV
jgi:hypothetical protein